MTHLLTVCLPEEGHICWCMNHCFADCSAAVQGEDYVLDAAAPEIQFLSAARGLKRKFSVQVRLLLRQLRCSPWICLLYNGASPYAF